MAGPRSSQSLRIIVCPWLIREPIGGMAWHHLQYVMGLLRLGHDVYCIEGSGDTPSCMHPWTGHTDTDPDEGLRFATEAFARLQIGERWAYHDAHSGCWLGPCADRVEGICRTADLLLNLSGWASPLRPWLMEIPTRVFFDTDPAFTQILHLTDPVSRSNTAKHNVFFPFGENITKEGCGIPDDGIPWHTTRQPVVLQAWPVTPGRRDGKFTTVMSWASYYTREYNSVRYGMKSDSLGHYLEIPSRTGSSFELAVNKVSREAIEVLRANGWGLVAPREASSDLATYQAFIQESKAEFSVAKHGYVVSRSGWFSERSAAYLASGRPVILQDTGFSNWLPTGLGVIGFTNPDEAVSAIDEVNARYEVHCRAARELACEYFDAEKILSSLVEVALHPDLRQNDSAPSPPPAR